MQFFDVDSFASVCNKITSFGTCHTNLPLDLGVVGMVPFKSTFSITKLLLEKIWVRASLMGDHVKLGMRTFHLS